MVLDQDTIVAIATPPGKGGVGVIRLSGSKAKDIGEKISGLVLKPRIATYALFKDNEEETIDTGLVLFFSGPKSFTGEDVVELQGHGGPVILDMMVRRAIELGARPARAGEFSERAFLNDKIDLAQAEAIADLIDSSTSEAAKGAVRSLQGEFSNKINELLKELIYLRMYVEAAIDFPDEEIDFLADDKIRNSIEALLISLKHTIAQAGQGAILRNGLRLVIAGRPNAGKSSLLNALAGQETAIVTEVAGTTRDIVNETIDIDGLPVHIIDTAGLRNSSDKVEKIGIERARVAIKDADHVLFLIDASESPLTDVSEFPELEGLSLTKVFNKKDLLDEDFPHSDGIAISAKNGDGLNQLRDCIKDIVGYSQNSESIFTARRRHISSLSDAMDSVERGLRQLKEYNAGELLADELLQAQNSLNQITGEFSSDDLLGEIFGGFCIGK